MADSIIRLFDYSTISRSAFTLIELMLVMAIMGLLGTLSIGGYRAMRRGMEQRGVWMNVEAFMENARLRALIDHQPVAVYFWNETRREESDTASLLVVGRAVAVRRAGRISRIDGNYIVDEFGDFRADEVTDEDGEEESDGGKAQAEKDGVVKTRLYRMNGNESGSRDSDSSIVSQMAVRRNQTIPLMLTDSDWDDNVSDDKVLAYGYYTDDADDWNVGYAYGFEFAEITLPNNYIFGGNFSQKADNPIADGPTAIRFKPGDALTMPTLSAIRMGDNGNLTADRIVETK